jgi:hypothetical protein
MAEKPDNVSNATHPVNYTYAPSTADEIIAMSADGIEKLVVLKLIDRVKRRLAIIAAEEAEQKAKENLNSQKQYGTYCGADNCECPQDRREDPPAIRSGSPTFVDTSGINERDDYEEDSNGRNDANDLNDDDVLWDWNGGIWC